MRSISVAQLAAQLKNEKPLLLDVREPWEYEICHIDGSINRMSSVFCNSSPSTDW
jgi:rhodanese-related sulfurtransferase